MKVLVATDGSEHSMKAVQRALEMAEKEGAKVTLMAVAYFSGEGLDEMPPNIQEKLENEAAAALRKAQGALRCKGHCRGNGFGSGSGPGQQHSPEGGRGGI